MYDLSFFDDYKLGEMFVDDLTVNRTCGLVNVGEISVHIPDLREG